MHCFTVVLSRVRLVLHPFLTTAFVLYSTSYVHECAKTWDCYGLQVDRLLHMDWDVITKYLLESRFHSPMYPGGHMLMRWYTQYCSQESRAERKQHSPAGIILGPIGKVGWSALTCHTRGGLVIHMDMQPIRMCLVFIVSGPSWAKRFLSDISDWLDWCQTSSIAASNVKHGLWPWIQSNENSRGRTTKF